MEALFMKMVCKEIDGWLNEQIIGWIIFVYSSVFSDVRSFKQAPSVHYRSPQQSLRSSSIYR